jgi:hypothetical protein
VCFLGAFGKCQITPCAERQCTDHMPEKLGKICRRRNGMMNDESKIRTNPCHPYNPYSKNSVLLIRTHPVSSVQSVLKKLCTPNPYPSHPYSKKSASIPCNPYHPYSKKSVLYMLRLRQMPDHALRRASVH